jgi:Skp1 family, dimerisation domain
MSSEKSFTYLTSLDGTVFMPDNVVKVSTVLQNMIDDCIDITMTPLNFPLQDLINYIKLCELRINNCIDNDPLNDKLTEYEESYLESLSYEIESKYRLLDPVGNIICISDFLNNEDITDCCAKYIVLKLSQYSGGKEDIKTLRNILQIENDFTTEEEEKVRKANAWCCK